MGSVPLSCSFLELSLILSETGITDLPLGPGNFLSFAGNYQMDRHFLDRELYAKVRGGIKQT